MILKVSTTILGAVKCELSMGLIKRRRFVRFLPLLQLLNGHSGTAEMLITVCFLCRCCALYTQLLVSCHARKLHKELLYYPFPL